MDSEPVDNGLEASIDNIRKVYVGALRDAFNIDDTWRLVSTNVSRSFYKKIVKVAGRDSIKQVSSINMPKNVSITMFISPEGVSRLKEYDEAKHI